MFKFLISKLLHKKWMVLCLLIGNILLISIAISYPMYKNASLNRMLSDELSGYQNENGAYPGIISASMTRKKSYVTKVASIDELFKANETGLGVALVGNYRTIFQQDSTCEVLSDRDDLSSDMKLRISTMDDFENHIKILAGRSANSGQETIEAVVSEATMAEQKLLVGDRIEFTNVKNADGSRVIVEIVGAYTCLDNTDPYWVNTPNSYVKNLFIPVADFEKLYLGDINQGATLKVEWNTLVDTDALAVSDIDALELRTQEYISAVSELGAKTVKPQYLQIFEEFKSKSNRVMASLSILQVPILILLCAFLFMISGQMLSMEQSEISILKSRGASGGQIFRLYLGQSGLLAVVSAVFALPLGMLICEILGSSNAFLEFVRRRALSIAITPEVLLYAVGAIIVSILVTVIPVISYSKVSIVNLKQKKSRSTKKLWQKLYLDVIILAVSLYGFYVFNGQKEELTVRVMSGASLDPLLYFSSSLFILGAGLFAIRLWPLFVNIIFKAVKKLIKPETYASFLQIIRTGSRQQFIMMFLVLTVALGMFNATVARTILSNAEENTAFMLGADLVVLEKWKDNSAAVKAGVASELIYVEPDYSKYNSVEGVNNTARVLNSEGAVGNTKTRVLGIVTNEFGRVVKDTGLDQYALNDYLNVLSTRSDAVLVSESYRTYLGYNLGDTINVKVGDKTVVCRIYGFFNYFPTFVSSSVSILEDGSAKNVENYMLVANLSYLQSVTGVTPYELWMDLDEAAVENVAEFIETNNINMLKFTDAQTLFYEIRNETLFQGTNGILTMSFIVILILCGVGFLIYWILSIRERELLFGVFRAMGMSQRSVIKMLLNEQLFSSVLFTFVGALIGAVVSKLFVPLIQIAYTADNQVLPLKLITQTSDMIRLFVIIVLMFVICMVVLARLIFTMKITNALKLGED